MVDLVEDDQGATGSRAVVVENRFGSNLRIGQSHPVVAGCVFALGVLEVRVELDAHACCRVGPLHLEMFSGSDDGGPVDDPLGQQFGRQTQSEGGLTGPGGRDREEVLGLLLEVEFESLSLPGTQLSRRSPCCALGECRWKLFCRGGPWC